MDPGAFRGEFSSADAVPESGPQQAIGPYLRAVRRHWFVVLALTLLTTGVAAFTVLRSGRTYQASASVLVTPLPQGDPTFIGLGVVLDSGDPARTVQTAAALIDSSQAAAAAASALGPSWNTQRVQDAVSVTPLGQSDVLSITASGSTPAQAARLANEFARAAVANRGAVVQRNISTELTALEAHASAPAGTAPSGSSGLPDTATRISELRAVRSTGGDPTLAISQPAQRPVASTGASRSLVLLLSLIGGFALASVAALALEFFSRPVRDEDELRRLFPAPILASIPRVRHRRGMPVAPWRLPPAAFEQVRMLRVQLELSVSAPVIMVTSAGAGDGKTTVVAALAAAFSESAQDVIVMDLDLRRPSLAKALEAVSLGAPPPAAKGRKPETPPFGALLTIPKLPNVKLLPFPGEGMSTIDEIMLRLPLLIAQAQRSAACVILDTAPLSEVSETLRIAPMCETVVFVARPRHTDRRRLVLARDLLNRAGARVAGIVLVGQPPVKRASGYYGYARPAYNGSPANDEIRAENATRVSGRSEGRDG